MANSNTRDVSMVLSVETLGAEDIKKLQTTVANLAKEGGDAAPEFQRLADEIGRLGNQADVLKAFTDLSEQTSNLSTRQEAAATNAQELRTRLTALSAVTGEAATKQRAAADALNAARTAAATTRDELATLIVTTDRAGKAEASYAEQVQRLKLAKIEQRAEIERLAGALTESNAEVSEAERAEAALAKSYERAEKAAERAAQAVRDNAAATQAASDAALDLGIVTDNVASAQAEIVQDLNRAARAADDLRQAMERLAASERELTAVRAEAERQARETAEASEAAANAISQAFRDVGIKSAAELEAQIDQVTESMRLLAESGDLTGDQLDGALQAGAETVEDLERELRRVNNQLTLADQAADLFGGSLGQITAGNLIADGIGFLVNKVKELGGAFIKTLVDTQQLRKGLKAIYEDTQIANKQFDFLRQSATNAGVAVGELQPAFLKFSAATKASGIPLAQTNELFAQLVRSSASLGVTTEGVTGALEALGQMASKGTVSMEELRQQLGDRIPGALGLVAKGIGVTETQLIKLVENGGLQAEDLFTGLTKSLQGLQGSTEGLLPEYNKLKNVLTATAQTAGDSVWATILSSALSALTFVAVQVVKIFSDISEGVGLLGKGIALLLPGLGSLKDRMALFGEEVEAADRRQKKFQASLDGTTKSTKAATDKQELLGAAVTETALRTAEASVSTITTNVALEAQAKAAELAANKNGDLGLSLVQLKLYIDGLLASQKEEVEASAKIAKAVKIQGDTLVALTELRGQDFRGMQAQSEASQKYAEALGKVEQAQRTETELLILKRDEIIRTRTEQGKSVENMKDEVAAINLKIVASAAETEQVKQASAAGKLAALERNLAVQSYKDNSAAIGEFKLALESAQANLAAFESEQAAGRKTDEQVNVVRRQLAEATYLYNDALKDSVDALDLESRAKQANISLTQAKVTAEQRNYESIAQALKFSGNYALAMYFEIEAKKKQIEIIKLTVAAKRIEADATIRAIELELSALKPGVELYEQKKLEIEVRLANAKAKLLEADAGKAQISALELEIRAMREAEDAIGNDTQARGQNTGAIRGQTGALREQIQVLGAFKDAQDLAARGKQGDSVLNPDGTRTSKNAGGQLSTTGGRLGYTISGEKNRLYDFINKGAPIATGDADFIRSNFKSASAELESSQKNATFYSFDGIKSALDEYNKARRALDALNEAEALASYVPPTTGALTVAPQGTQPVRQGDVPPRAGATQTVNINILGRSMQVNVVGQEDVNNLTSVFRQLETAAATAGRATR